MLFTAVASELHQEKEKAEGVSDVDGKEVDQQQQSPFKQQGSLGGGPQ